MQAHRNRRPNGSWDAEIVPHAAEIVSSYDTGVTLRQLFYRLVADETLRNMQTEYSMLSAYTARARREGRFPALIDRGRRVHRMLSFVSAEQAIAQALDWFRLDRAAAQPSAIYIGTEKATMVEQLRKWFEDVPVVALGGYSSQTYVDEIATEIVGDGRPSVLVYAGDFDPSGEDIDRDFIERTGVFDTTIRIALTPEQIEQYDLPVQPGKATDSRSAAFELRHGRLIQVELEALEPGILRGLYEAAIADYFDEDLHADVLAREAEQQLELEARLR